MNKWLFNDCCGLTAAVKSGYKTMTRRVAKDIEKRYEIDQYLTDMLGNPTGKSETLEEFALRVCPITVGEVVEYQGEHLLCVEKTNNEDCSCCAFLAEDDDCKFSGHHCHKDYRSDGKNVFFVKGGSNEA